MENLNIERAKEKDLNAILALQKASFSIVAEKMNNFDIPPLLQTLDEIMKEYQQGVILKCVSDDNKIIGSVRGVADENGVCHIGKLIVHPDFQNRGIGKKLMYEIETFFQKCHMFSLFTGENTPNTLQLYEKVGYNIVSIMNVDGINMIIMEKKENCL